MNVLSTDWLAGLLTLRVTAPGCANPSTLSCTTN